MPTEQHTDPTAAPANAEHVSSSGWAWRWTGWASWPISTAVLWVCAVAVVVDVATSWWGQPEWYLGRVSMSVALPLGVALVALIGPRNLGFSRRTYHATCQARSFGPGGQRYGATWIDST